MGDVNHRPEKQMSDSVWSVKNTFPEVYQPMEDSNEESICHIASSLMHEGKFDEAESYFKLGMSEGYMKVANIYATALSTGWLGRVDEELAYLMFQKLAYKHYPIAMYNYGCMILGGHGTKADHKRGTLWIDRAADAGVDVAMTSKGVRIAFESGDNPDYKSAFDLFAMSAEMGDATAMYQLGLMYLHGNHVEKDYEIAVKWFRKAVDLGDGCFPEYHLARCYHLGKGVPKNDATAKSLLQDAIEHGLPEDMYPKWYGLL